MYGPAPHWRTAALGVQVLIAQAPYYQSGRVSAVARVLLATFFLFALIISSSEGTDRDELIGLLATYVFWSAALLAGVRQNWWLDRKLGGIAHAADIAVFCALIFLTKGYASPFLTFSVFLVLSALVRWGWKSAALTAVLVAVLFLGIGLKLSSTGPEPLQMQPFVLLAGGNLIVLTAIIMWFAANERHLNSTELLQRFSFYPAYQSPMPLAATILRVSSEALASDQVVLVWWEKEEPWLNVSALRDDQINTERLPPKFSNLISPELSSAGVFLFDLRRRRILLEQSGLKALHHQMAIDPQFAAAYRLSNGIRVPVRAEGFEGEVLIEMRARISSDDVQRGTQLGVVLSELFHRSVVLAKTDEAAVTRERLALAQDLHDSVIQFLAGMAMKLEGIRKAALKNKSIDEDVATLQQELKREQRDLRNFIVTLRGSGGPPKNTDIAKNLGYLANRLSSQWGIDCRVEYEKPVIGSSTVQQDLENLVRETVSNAVRHGGADKLLARVFEEPNGIRLEVQDNGKGFPNQGEFSDDELRIRRIGPWSLHERVRKRGGELHLSSTTAGAKLSMRLPMEVENAANFDR